MGDLSANFSTWEFKCPCGCNKDNIDMNCMRMDAADSGLQGIPPDMLVALSDLPDKGKWIQRIMETIQDDK